MNETLAMPKKQKGNKPRKFNLNIPSVFEIFGITKKDVANRNDFPNNMLFLPTEHRIHAPMQDTSMMAKKWAMGKL